MIKAIICAKFLTYGYVDLGDCGTLGGGGGAWKGGLDAANRPVPPCINLLVIMKTTPTEIILEINDHTHTYSQTIGGRTVQKLRRQKSSSHWHVYINRSTSWNCSRLPSSSSTAKLSQQILTVTTTNGISSS